METKTSDCTHFSWVCEKCGQTIPLGCVHMCNYNPQYSYNYNTPKYCVCCPQIQKLMELTSKLEALLKKLEENKQ